MERTDRYGNVIGDGGSRDEDCVLIVDDDGDFLGLVGLYLTMEGFRVTSAENGDEALALVKSKKFSFMVTDYTMPDMDGLKLSEEVLKTVPGLTIVMMTGNPSTPLCRYASALGIRAVLAKPLDIDELLRIVRKNPA